MLWQYILTTLSAILFFGFVIISVRKFGLLDCYSAYGPAWGTLTPGIKGFNIWSLVTVLSAFLLVPVSVGVADGSPWQFAGFLCPVLILFVGLTPDYKEDKMAGIIHLVCATLGAVLAIVYILCVFPHLWWLLVLYVVLAVIFTLATGIRFWCFWFEMAAYAGIYTTVFLMI